MQPNAVLCASVFSLAGIHILHDFCTPKHLYLFS